MKTISIFSMMYKLFMINLFTFGGGYMIMPMIKNEFVDEGFIEETEILDIISISQSIPGVMAISTSYLLGYRLKGYKGAILAVIASILPCIIVIGIISKIYDFFIKSSEVKFILKGLSGAISAILLISTYNFLKKINEDKKRILYFILILLSLIMKLYFKLSLIYILIIFSLIGLFIKRGDEID